MTDNAPSMLKATMIGGAVAGFAASIPFVNIPNCCCLYVVGGGFLAAFLYSKECRSVGYPFSAGGGATVGLVAGLFYTIVATLGSAVAATLSNTSVSQAFEEIIAQIEDQGSEVPEFLYSVGEFFESTGTFMLVLIGFFFTLLIAALFSTLGGLIGGAVFKSEPAPTEPPLAPPPTSPTI